MLMRVRQAVLAVTPLRRNARQAGLSDRDAHELVVASALITAIVWLRHWRYPWQQNAVRHFAWQAWLTLRHGSTVANSIALGHERRSADALDHQVDLRNNSVAQAYGRAHPEVALHPLRRAIWQLIDVGERKWRAGELWTGRGGRVRLHHSG